MCLRTGTTAFRQARLFVPGVNGEVEDRDARVSQAIGNVRAKQTSIRPNVDPESFFRRVVHHLVGELRTQQRFASHQRQHSATVIVEPVNRATCHVLSHPFYFVVEGPAVPAVEIAFVLDEQISNDGMKIARKHARTNIGKQPAAHFVIHLRQGPVALLGNGRGTGIGKLLWILRENGLR